ncbi:MAG: type II secretion system protein [Pseudomonadota bacterium]
MSRPREAESGYTYLMLLFGVAAMGLITASATQSWATLAQREREQELLFAGNQYREALRRYFEAIPDAVQRHPAKLEELVEDTRFGGTRRHLRRLYPDPLTGQADWVLLRRGERIVGVHSRATGRPFKQNGFGPRDQEFAGAGSYADWKFVATPATAPVPTQGQKVGAGKTASVNSPSGPVLRHESIARP